MTEILTELVDRMFVGPVVPASILVSLLLLYTLIALVGLVDLDLEVPDTDFGMDLDVDMDIDVPDASTFDFALGLGATSLRFVNFGRVPIAIWGGIFTVLFWSISYGLWHNFDSSRYEPVFWVSALLSTRNFVLATFATKFVTQPLVKYFVAPPQYDSGHLIGATCEISSLEATIKFGTAKFRTDAAPLLLNVRTEGETFSRGDEVRIVAFDSSKRIYTVRSIESENLK